MLFTPSTYLFGTEKVLVEVFECRTKLRTKLSINYDKVFLIRIVYANLPRSESLP